MYEYIAFDGWHLKKVFSGKIVKQLFESDAIKSYTLKEIPFSLESNERENVLKFDAVEKAVVCYGIDGTYFTNNFSIKFTRKKDTK